jgi:hypothetical protein
MVHRASLLIDGSFHLARIESSGLSTKAKHRLSAGATICVNAARSIIRTVSDLLANHSRFQLLSPTPCVLAVYILLINMMRSPRSWTATSDLEVRNIEFYG